MLARDHDDYNLPSIESSQASPSLPVSLAEMMQSDYCKKPKMFHVTILHTIGCCDFSYEAREH